MTTALVCEAICQTTCSTQPWCRFRGGRGLLDSLGHVRKSDELGTASAEPAMECAASAPDGVSRVQAAAALVSRAESLGGC